MKNIILSAVCAAAFLSVSAPVNAGSLSDPIVEAAVVADAAVADSTKLDGLLVAIWATLLIVTIGGV